MRYKRYLAAALSALCLCGAVSCGSKDSSSSTDDKAEAESTAPTDPSTEAEASSEPAKASAGSLTLGERVSPAEGDEEYDLGDYYVSSSGVKLYFEPDEYPEEMVLAMERYFTAYASGDYEAYTACLYPSYIDEMNKFLEAEYQYGLDKSFDSQCESLKSNAGSAFTVTRIKLEAPETEGIENFFEYPSSCFGKDYYAEIKDSVDKFYDAMFYIMAADENGEETLLVSDFEIVFAEKDGVFYTFG